jgi:hypothetical protein
VFFLGLIPGEGAIYNGEYNKAAVHLAIFVALSVLVNYVPREMRDR